MVEQKRTYGLELEKVVSDSETQEPHGMSQASFVRLELAGEQRGQHPHRHLSDVEPNTIVGIVTHDLGEQGVDNGWNLQETALPYQHDLGRLSELANLDFESVQESLQEEGATLVNMAIHPLGKTDRETYQAFIAPKSVYRYITYRGWDHTAGIDAKAQNSPATGVSAEEAADAVSVVIGSGAAVVGLFGNSPYAEGKATGMKESRLTIWDRMMKNSKVAGDRRTSEYPDERFRTLADYFQWMHSRDTGIHFVVAAADGTNYKSLGDQIMVVDGNPSVLQYLSQEKWNARFLNDILQGETDKKMEIVPEVSHMEAMQFAQFAGARVRYGLKSETFPIQDFVEACKKQNNKDVERIFETHAKYIYIEGRDAGSNFPDSWLHDAGDDIASSVVIAPSAIQAGLIRNLSEATRLLDKYGWERLGELRQAAIEKGLEGEAGGVTVMRFTQDVFETAARGLGSDEQWMLSYPEMVMAQGKNGADRAIEFVESHPIGGRQALRDLVKSRSVIAG
jgi:hypothetical protein